MTKTPKATRLRTAKTTADWPCYRECSAYLGELISSVLRPARDVLDQGATSLRPEEDLQHGEIERNADRKPAGAGGQLGDGGGASSRVEPPPAIYRYVGGGGAPLGQPSSDEQRAENGNKHNLPTRKGLAAQVP